MSKVIQFIVYLFFFSYLKGRVRERERDLPLATSLTQTTAAAGSDRSQELETWEVGGAITPASLCTSRKLEGRAEPGLQLGH